MEQVMGQIKVIAGPDVGREFDIAPGGARVGRSSSNDIVLSDPSMSRFHCRFYFKESEGLWAEDLGSANQTLLNGQPLHVSRVQPGDMLTIGDTEIKVVSDGMPAIAVAVAAPDAPPPVDSPSGIVPGNLFETPQAVAPSPAQQPRASSGGRLLAVALVTLLLAAGGYMAWMHAMQAGRSRQAAGNGNAETGPEKIEIHYEKVQAGPRNVFRYAMEIRDNQISVQLDDLENRRHVAGGQRKKIDPHVARSLADEVRGLGFFDLQENYRGLATNVWDQWELSITIGRQSGRVRVLNAVGPDNFRRLCHLLEEFGRNELGLAALAMTPEKLLELAEAAAQLGRNLYDQRRVKNENLSLAIRALREAEYYLETIEPKPEFYPDVIALLEQAERELDEIYKDHVFQADRAIRLNDWQEAAVHLRAICEKIPDRSDDRHAGARRRLIDVERRLKGGR